MRVGLLKNFLHCFTLKQGTILIAILHLLMTSVVLTVCLLALFHVMDIQTMVIRDSEDAMEREAFEDINSLHVNTRRMEIAHHNATVKVTVLYSGLVLMFIHLICVLQLLYGVSINNRKYMVPWMLLSFIQIVGLIIALFFVHEYWRMGLVERLLAFTAITMKLYCYFVAYSTYRSLGTKKGLTHEVHETKKKYPQSPVACTKSLTPVVTQPFDV